MGVSAVSVAALRHIYHSEPGGIRGLWQLSIIDLYALILFTALWMAVMRAARPEVFVPAGVGVSLTMGLGYAISLLVAARKGFKANRHKIPYAAGLLFKAAGLLALGALVATCIFMLIVNRGSSELRGLVAYCLFLNKSGGDRVFEPVRNGLALLPAGMLLCWWVRRLKKEDDEPGTGAEGERPSRNSGGW
jgi:hypothetical protein